MKKIYSKKELKHIKPDDFPKHTWLTITDDKGDKKYSVLLDGLKSLVQNYNTGNYLNCTPGTKNGWPYYIADFIYRK